MLRYICLLAAAVILSTGSPARAQHAGAGHTQHSDDAEIATLAALRRGGTVLFFRHERTDVTRLDDADYRLEDCATQRNLSVAGIANSQQTGDYIRRLGIPVGQVFASPMCRCLETARYAFGKVQALPELMGDHPAVGRTMDQAGVDLRELVRTRTQPGKNTVLVAHFSNAFKAFGVRLLEGDAAVLRLNERGEPELVGVIGSHRWGDLIRDEVDHRPRATHARPTR